MFSARPKCRKGGADKILDQIDGEGGSAHVHLRRTNMNPGYNTDLCDAVQDLITGLSGETMYWVDGNCGPYALYTPYGKPSGLLTSGGLLLQELGVQILKEPIPITRNGESIFLTPKFTLMQIRNNLDIDKRMVNIEGLSWEEMAEYYARLQIWYDYLTQQDQVLIAISHFPEQLYIAELSEQTKPLPYDLIICGHTHGGQIRLPFIGAIYIPSSATYRGGWFPADKDTHGLNIVQGVQQYISAGLGSSQSIPVFSFRFNCPPEINQIVLHCAEIDDG